MNLIQKTIEQISKEHHKNYYDVTQAEEELGNMLQSYRLFKMKELTLNFIKKITGKDENTYTLRLTGTFLSSIINELKIQYKIKEYSMWKAQSEKLVKQKVKKERVNFLISKEYRNRFKEICNKNGLIMSVFVENAIRRYVDGR